MAKKQSTKKALLMSLLSLLLCCSMLIGSTFAWFTDSVTSSNNRIVAGNLDIDLLMDKGGDDYISIANTTGEIFSESGNGINWEPGKTEIVYLAVRNLGSLAAKYNILVHVKGDLSDALEYVVIDGAKRDDLKGVTNWTELKAIEGAQYGTFKEELAKEENPGGLITAAQNGRLPGNDGTNKEDATDYFALAVHMREEAGNEFMNKQVVIDVTVVAGQAQYESDSFGTDYDANAPYADYFAETLEDLQKALDEINNDNNQSESVIVLGGDMKVTEDTTLEIPEGRNVTIDIFGNDFTLVNGSNGDDKSGIHVGAGANLTITDTIGDGKLDLTVSDHTGSTFEGGTMDLDQKSFPILVEGDGENKATVNFQDIVIEIHDDNENAVPVSIMAKSNAELNLNAGTVIKGSGNGYACVYISDGSTVNVNGATIDLEGAGTAFVVGSDEKEESVLNINSGSIQSSCGNGSYIIEVNACGTVNMNGGSIRLYGDLYRAGYDEQFGFVFLCYTGGSLNVIGGEITVEPTTGVGIVIYGSAYSADPTMPTCVVGGNAVVNLNATKSGQAWGFLVMVGTAYVRDNAQINATGSKNQNGMLNPGWSAYDSHVKDER